MKSQLKHMDILLSLLEETDRNIKVMIIESVEFIHMIRKIMPNADITVVLNDESAIDKRKNDEYGVHWIQGDYLSKILPVEPESIDIIIGEELFFNSELLLESVRAFCTYLSETGFFVTWFKNALYWKIVVDVMKGWSPHPHDRIFTDKAISELLRNAYFRDVNFTPVRDNTDDGKTHIERLVSMNADIAPEVLGTKAWCVRAAKFEPDRLALKRRYDKKVRWELITRLHRVEHGIGVIANTAAIIYLVDDSKMELSDVSRYILNHINHIGEFIGNLAPGFYESGRVEMLRELLHTMVDVYQGHVDYDTVIEWKECIDALDEYPEELLPIAKHELLNQSGSLNRATENKIAFIACVNDEECYHEWQLYINNLVVPAGMAVELVPVWGAKSICQGYNMGMRQTDAKYKVYLHQDVLITNKNFIEDMLGVFADNTIGAFGVIGARTLPPDGVWWDANDQVGCAMEVDDPESIYRYWYPEFNGKCIDVEAVDGILIATQVDIEWREDLFTGWHFYDVSQCQEMQRHGYRVVVPKQNDYWVLHYSSLKFLDYSYEKYRAVFVNEYIT